MKNIKRKEVNNLTSGEKLKKARKQRGFTQAKLAKAIKKTGGLICKIENDKANQSIKTLRSIAKVLNVKLHDLVGD